MKTLFALMLLSACVVSAATEDKINKTFTVSPGGELVVEVGFGSIEVVASPDFHEVSVEGWRKITRSSEADEVSFLKDNPIELSQEGNTVIVRAPARMSWSWFSGWRNRNEARYTVHVPTEFSTKLKTSGGSIAVSNVSGSVKANISGGSLRFTNVHGPIDGHTSGGSIKTVDCTGDLLIGTSGGSIDVAGGSGSLHGNTSGGSVTVKTFNGPVEVGTSGGGITIENTRGKISGHTSGGSIHATLLSPIQDDIELTTSGGGVTVKVPADAAFALDAGTSGGGVHSDLPVTTQGDLKHNHIKGTINGGGPSVQLHTSGGGINVQKL